MITWWKKTRERGNGNLETSPHLRKAKVFLPTRSGGGDGRRWRWRTDDDGGVTSLDASNTLWGFFHGDFLTFLTLIAKGWSFSEGLSVIVFPGWLFFLSPFPSANHAAQHRGGATEDQTALDDSPGCTLIFFLTMYIQLITIWLICNLEGLASLVGVLCEGLSSNIQMLLDT